MNIHVATRPGNGERYYTEARCGANIPTYVAKPTTYVAKPTMWVAKPAAWVAKAAAWAANTGFGGRG